MRCWRIGFAAATMIAAVALGFLPGCSSSESAATEHPEPSPPPAAAPDPLGCIAPAGDPAYPGAQWTARDALNVICATQGNTDAATNLAAFAEESSVTQARPDGYLGDPFREPVTHWNGKRGRYQVASFRDRNGAEQVGSFYLPLQASGARAGAMVICHICTQHLGSVSGDPYIWIAEGLAEAGYVVWVPTVDGDEPALDALAWFFATPDAPTAAGEFNPFWAELDRSRVAAVGHSGAGSNALVAGYTDTRVRALVSLDRSRSGGPPDHGHFVPTLYLTTEYIDPMIAGHNSTVIPIGLPAPMLAPPQVLPGTKYADHQRLVAAGIDTLWVTPRASTHTDLDIFGAPGGPPESRYGARVAFYYTLAWLDQYLRDRPDALDRLTATTFDDSADASSIGMGTYDPLSGANQPYRIAGIPVADLLSFYYPSGYSFAGGAKACADLRRR